MNDEALLKLADMLEADAANPKGMKFNLRKVIMVRTPLDTEPSISCGTVGCAMGLAALSGEFPGLGFTTNHGNEYTTKWKGLRCSYSEAAELAFDIGYYTAQCLFGPQYYPEYLMTGADAELEVARRIRFLVEHGSIVVGCDFTVRTGR
jgi:hypothetical protein